MILSFATASFRSNFRPLRWAYDAALSIDLPGAKHVRMAPASGILYQSLVHEVSRRCNTLITMPGLNSLYLFTGIEPPTKMNTTAWFTLLNRQQQDAIVRELAQASGTVCAVRNENEIAHWARITGRDDLKQTPLARYIEREFVPVVQIGDYEVMVRHPQ
jgi:hypothetical protein